ncbi:hypothetical protein [Streptomyces europaeiscabiei]|uniref:hypothetical protein n=1 Tax=Streptomyces europaeiscabiei TaxID=146819 RepID=UPI0029CA4845|nr:hypothetical protein [Streptomyces europaeiscabiei]
MRELPAGQLADRLPNPASYGTIGAAGLASPDELVAVVGRAPSDPAVSKAAEGGDWYDEGQTTRAVVSGCTATKPSVFTDLDQQMAVLGVALLVMPVIVPASAAGRLGAARGEQRLPALRHDEHLRRPATRRLRGRRHTGHAGCDRRQQATAAQGDGGADTDGGLTPRRARRASRGAPGPTAPPGPGLTARRSSTDVSGRPWGGIR